MGQQQLLLIVLGLIIVAVAVVIGINVFTASSTSNKRDLVINESIQLASLAQQHYRKPVAFGGGGREFTNWSIPPRLTSSVNGTFTAAVAANQVVITGVGNEIVSGNTNIEITITVSPDSHSVVIVH